MTDTSTQTSIKGLYTIGETASTGVHGANRLTSNSLLECLVYVAQLSRLKIDNTQKLPSLKKTQEKIKLNLSHNLILINKIH